jgi:hypothetical protein
MVVKKRTIEFCCLRCLIADFLIRARVGNLGMRYREGLVFWWWSCMSGNHVTQ